MPGFGRAMAKIGSGDGAWNGTMDSVAAVI